MLQQSVASQAREMLLHTFAVEIPLLPISIALAGLFWPLQSVHKGTELDEDPDGCKRNEGGDTKAELRPQATRHKIEGGGECEDRKIQGGEVVVQEQLALHQEEREVVQKPRQGEEADVGLVLGLEG